MNNFIKFLTRRLGSMLLTLFVMTAIMYGLLMLFPAEQRAELYLGEHISIKSSEEEEIEKIILRYGLRDPYPVQYVNWVWNLLQGKWGRSPVLNADVFALLIRMTPTTAELTFYSVLVMLPLGLFMGMLAGWYKDRAFDFIFRLVAFMGTSIPTFILSFILLATFYVMLPWFGPGRLDVHSNLIAQSDAFKTITGFLTIDGLLNGNPEISLQAARHLVMPVFTLALLHWATLSRLTRTVVIEEVHKEYTLAAFARGASQRRVIWHHILRNVLSPALTSSALSAASLVTGVFVVEIIFNFKGVSQLIVSTHGFSPDVPAVMGFSIYSIVVVLLLMFIFDVIKAWVDPQLRETMASQ